MQEPVFCFLPCRAGSERVPRKNLRPISRFQHGLIEIKLAQLLASRDLAGIILSTDDPEIIAYAEGLGEERILVHRRDPALASSATSTDELVPHVAQIMPEGHVLWTHVTSPFLTGAHYDEAISAYASALADGFDSLMSTTLLHEFLWTETGPINYDRAIERWPRTQTLEPVHEVNSGVFLAPLAVYRDLGDRVGSRPKLWPINRITAMDIDWEEDFVLAEQMIERGIART